MDPVFYEVETIGSGFLAVMAKPVAEWIDEEFAGLARAGIRQIVSLLEEREAFELGLQSERSHCAEHGISFVSYPIPDRGLPPTVAGFRELTKRLHGDVADGLSTVVHCRAGIGRTGLVAAGVLLHTILQPDEAFARVAARLGVEVPDTREQSEWLYSNYPTITE